MPPSYVQSHPSTYRKEPNSAEQMQRDTEMGTCSEYRIAPTLADPGVAEPLDNEKWSPAGAPVPELIQWKAKDMVDDMSKLMKDDGKARQKKKISGEERVPELLQWKDQEMADGMSRLMAVGKNRNGDVEMEDHEDRR
jgi:hypothetical protein